MLVTEEDVLKAYNKCQPVNGRPFMQCMAKELSANKTIDFRIAKEEAYHDPFNWLDWRRQLEGAPILVDGVKAIFFSITDKGIHSSMGIEPDLSKVKPDFSRIGHWFIDPDNRMTRSPEGLSSHSLFMWRDNLVWQGPSDGVVAKRDWSDVLELDLLEV